MADGWLRAWHRDDGGNWRQPQQLATTGSVPCHVSYDDESARVLVVNHASGTVVAFDLDDGGLLREIPQTIWQGEIDRALPHQVLRTDAGLAVIDLGQDAVVTSGTEHPPQWRALGALPSGTGPRHGAIIDGDLVAISAERSGAVCLWDGRQWHTVASSTRQGLPVSRGTRNAPGDLVVRGRFAYVANRGDDTVGIVDIEQRRLIAEVDVGGRWPQHFLALEDRLLVACEDSHEVRSLPWLNDGLLGPSSHEFSCPSPAWLLTA